MHRPRQRPRPLLALGAALLAVAAVAVSAGPAGASGQRAAATPQEIIAAARTLDSAGSGNDWTCTSTGEPVILVHGLNLGHFLGARDAGTQTWSSYAAALRSDGLCAFIFEYYSPGTLRYRAPDYDNLGSVAFFDATAKLEVYIEGVRLATGSAEVDLVGHSLGGPVARSTVKGGTNATRVDDVVSVDGTNHVTPPPPFYLAWIQSVREVAGADGGAFLDELNGPGDSAEVVPGVSYTSLAQAGQAGQVNPYVSATQGPAGSATNFLFFTRCIGTSGTGVPCSGPGAQDVFAVQPYLRTPAYAPQHRCPQVGGVLHQDMPGHAAIQDAATQALTAPGPLDLGYQPPTCS